ncbi:hypothetical protein [Scytonema sp. NUACC21]
MTQDEPRSLFFRWEEVLLQIFIKQGELYIYLHVSRAGHKLL